MTNLTSAQLVAALTALIQTGVLDAAKPKSSKHKLSRQIKKGAKVGTYTEQPDKKAQYEVAVLKGLNAKGFKNVQLRSEGPNGVQTYKGWLKLGRQVKKGQHGVKGCFHYSQTEPLAATKADLVATVAAHRAAPKFSDTDLHVA